MAESIQAQPKHRAFAALRQPGYGAYLGGTMLAMLADSIEHVISYWIIYEKFHSPALAGFAVISHWLPFLLFSIWSGALADRFDSRRIIQFGMLLFMLCSLGWGVLFATDTLQLWHAVVLLTMHGMAGVFWGPASQLLIHDIAGRDNLHSAVRLMAMARTLGLLGGPAVGGAMLLAFGPALGMLINVLIYVPLTWWLWKAPFGPAFAKATRIAPKVVRGFAGVVATAREITGNRIVMSMTLLAAASSFVIGNAYQAQMPEFAADLGHDHADFHYSMLLAANAAGALAAGLIFESYGLMQARPKLAVVLVILWAICIGGFAVSDIYALSIALLVAAGFLNLAFSAMAQTLVQLYAPVHIRGRVIGLYNMCFHGMRAFSGVTVGMAGSLIGVHWSLALSAVVMVVIGFGLLAFEMRPHAPE
ncbi:MAG TPA: MFS transporter [Xanthobacteraceae bacterium]|nr:MFS transporter [Xanthobacteraceae bacterium]